MNAIRRTARPLTWLNAQVDAEERRLLIQSVIVGIVVWAFVVALKWGVQIALDHTAALLAHTHVTIVWLPLLLGAAGVAAIANTCKTTVHYRDSDGVLHALDAVEGDGLERTIALYYTSEPAPERTLLGTEGVEVRWRLPTFSLALRKVLASILTLGSGGAGGLEASVILVGESAAAGLFKPRSMPTSVAPIVGDRFERARRAFRRALAWWRASQPEDLQAAQLCGIAAAIGTLLGTPFAAAFFAVEIVYRRRPVIDRLIYALVSALTAFFLNHLVAGPERMFPVVGIWPPIYTPDYYKALLALAVSTGLLATGFRRLRAFADERFHSLIRSRLRRHLAGALMTGTFAVAAVLLLGRLDTRLPEAARDGGAAWLVLGPGNDLIAWTMHGQLGTTAVLVVLVARFCATLSTITSGGSAGLLFPTLCFGSLVAAAWSDFFGLEPSLLVVPAMTASLACIANVPLAAILIVVEAFGAQWIVPALFVLVIAIIFAHQGSLYRAQRERFSPGQILPGVSVRRIRTPEAWNGLNLRQLGIRENFGLTVIGIVDRREDPGGDVEENIVLNPQPDFPLTSADLLIVLGGTQRIEDFGRSVSALANATSAEVDCDAQGAALTAHSIRAGGSHDLE